MNLPTQHLTWRRVSSMTIGFMMATGLMACSSEDKTPTTGNAEGSVAVSSNDTMAKCGRVSIANMNWQSAEVLAHIDKIILEKGFGCEVDLVPGDSVPTGASMTEKGEPDIAPELWLNSVREPIEKAVAENRLHIAGKSLIEGGTEGFWVPKYFMEAHPDIKTIADALNHPELFPSAENEKKWGRFMVALQAGPVKLPPSKHSRHGMPPKRGLN
jgi:glycine betaine/proline transport system substrate-binding protein